MGCSLVLESAIVWRQEDFPGFLGSVLIGCRSFWSRRWFSTFFACDVASINETGRSVPLTDVHSDLISDLQTEAIVEVFNRGLQDPQSIDVRLPYLAS